MLESDTSMDNALFFLRRHVTPLQRDVARVNMLTGLIMCGADELRMRVAEKLPRVASRAAVLESIEARMEPSLVIPPHRLQTLLDQALQYQTDRAVWHNAMRPTTLFADYTASASEFPQQATHVLTQHKDEVWYCAFSHSGHRLATCSPDMTIMIWDPYTGQRLLELVGHVNSVAFVSWSPDDSRLVSCSIDITARVWDTQTGACLSVCNGHTEPPSSCAWLSDKLFITGGLDMRIIIWNTSGQVVERIDDHRVYDMALSPDKHTLVTVNLKTFYVWDMQARSVTTSHEFEHEISSVTISRDSRYALFNVTPQEVRLWDLQKMQLVRKYTGQRQGRFVIRSCFGGADESFILSGSEDEMIYVWHRESGVLLERLPGHLRSVNCVAYNPRDPYMFASTGDDWVVRMQVYRVYSD